MPSRVVKEGLVWPVGAGELVMAVTRHQSLGPGRTPVPFQTQEAGRSGEETKALDRGGVGSCPLLAPLHLEAWRSIQLLQPKPATWWSYGQRLMFCKQTMEWKGLFILREDPQGWSGMADLLVRKGSILP